MTDNCLAKVLHRDTYRYCGRKSRFKMYYTEKQCKRNATNKGYCWQHQYLVREER